MRRSLSFQRQHKYLEILRAEVARERATSDRLGWLAWHAMNRSRRAVARARWAQAAAAVLADDAAIERLEERFRHVA